ncbi:MAG: SpoIIE family protein phosphatase [Chitinivibrionales bacterium]|nr:SpoIIE family protein phosphatase [Chitinivibrionales bacterium]MBD3356997.1 SpoIIE family protein phosphatase [Chitinivibrionales bacterium]
MTPFVEIGFHQLAKSGEHAAGDVFLSHKTAAGRVVCVLADGLGSGIKAHVLGGLTATMAMRFVAADIDMEKAAGIIMSTLPVCSERQIGYSTFTIVDITPSGAVSIVEYDNPRALIIAPEGPKEPCKHELTVQTACLGARTLRVSRFQASVGDRAVFFTDGVSQSGMGSDLYPLGWGENRARKCCAAQVRNNSEISARKLARSLVASANSIDSSRRHDDISCAVVYIRRPRKLLVLTGPPFDSSKDSALADILREFDGVKVICGGTTAQIMSRELRTPVTVDLSRIDPKIPPMSQMEGVDLVTEGALTLSRAAELLDRRCEPESLAPNAAMRLLEAFINSDSIHFIVGTRINEAHQDPNLPAELDIRRNLVRRIAGLLKENYLKETRIELI